MFNLNWDYVLTPEFGEEMTRLAQISTPGWQPPSNQSSTSTGNEGGGGEQINPPPPPPQPKPVNPWIKTSSYADPVGVKQADPDIVIFDTETISPELLIQLEYENISGAELINISRSDIIDGQSVVYSPIKNLSSIKRKYNPNNIIAIASGSSAIFSKYLIDLIARGMYEPYFNENGDLVIEINDVLDDELIEAEVDTSGTINRVEFL